MERPRYDVVVVGARCAGAATAMLLAQAGARVLLVDRDRYGSDTLSTHALMRPAVALLYKWGVLQTIKDIGTPPVRRSTFRYGDERVVIEIKPTASVDALYAPRRFLLDAALVDTAFEAGADVQFVLALEELTRDSRGRVNGVVLKGAEGDATTVHADLVVGADGRQSTVARAVAAQTYRVAPSRTATLYAYVEGLEDLGYRWSYRVGAAAGAIPTNHAGQCVFASLPPTALRELRGADSRAALLNALAEADPDLVEEVRDGRLQARPRFFLGAPGHLRQPHGPGWALVGDAGYFKDPLTAHGITDALRDASLLADALVTGGEPALGAYQAQRDRLSLPFFEATEAIASFDWDLGRLKALHVALRDAMAAEHDHLFGGGPATPLAA